MKTDKNFVVIGGGTGTFSVLSGLKKYTNNITAIVSMADSGGSAKKERDEWGLLPSSDIRKSLIALADVSSEDALLLRELFQYRFGEGRGLSGMTFGNLFLVTLAKILNSQELAIEKASEFLRIRGRVLPVTLKNVDLVATYEDGSKVVGEHFIDEPKHNGKIHIKNLTTTPSVSITPQVKESVEKADVIVIGPGGFYTTILANLVIGGMKESISKSNALKIFILNLMTEYGQTYGFTANEFMVELDKYLPTDNLDYVFINNSLIPDTILTKYKRLQATPVLNDLPQNTSYKVVALDLLSKKLIKSEKGDKLKRSFIRHNQDKLARACLKVTNLV